MPFHSLRGPAPSCDRIDFQAPLHKSLSVVSRSFKSLDFMGKDPGPSGAFPLDGKVPSGIASFNLKESPPSIRRGLHFGPGCIPPGICQGWWHLHPNPTMPPQEDPPVDRIFPDDPDFLLRDLEELPPVTAPPVKKPRSKPAASPPKAASKGETSPPPAKAEPGHSRPPGPGKEFLP